MGGGTVPSSPVSPGRFIRESDGKLSADFGSHPSNRGSGSNSNRHPGRKSPLPTARPGKMKEKPCADPPGIHLPPGATGRPFTKRRKSGKKIGEDSLLPIPVPPSGECAPIPRKSLTFRPSGTPSGAPRNPEDCADRPTRRRSAFHPRECRESQWEPPAGQNDAHRWLHPSG